MNGDGNVKSIKTKLISILAVFLLVVLTAITIVVTVQMQKHTEKVLLEQSTVAVEEMKQSIETFLTQNERALSFLSNSSNVTNFVSEKISVSSEHLPNEQVIEQELQNYASNYPEVTSVMIALETSYAKAYPTTELPEDYDPTVRDWYKDAMKNPDEITWSNPYEDAFTGEDIITLSKPVKVGERVVGALAVDLSLKVLTERLQGSQLGFDGFAFLYEKSGKAMVHPELELPENERDKSHIQVDNNFQQDKGIDTFEYYGKKMFSVYSTLPKFEWRVGAAFEKSAIADSFDSTRNMIIVLFVLAGVVIMIGLYFIIAKMLKPLNGLRDTMNVVAAGDLTVRATVQSKDEFGQLATHFNEMIEGVRDVISVVSHSVDEVQKSSESLSASAEETNAVSEQMADAVREIAVGAGQTASDTEDTMKTVDSLGQQIVQIHEKTARMAGIAQDAEAANSTGNEQVTALQSSFNQWKDGLESMATVVNELERKVGNIESVIETITSISTQTNLLALNASIEAARAGEHGKGFAVVAEEVRKLAEQSAQATANVRATIEELQTGANDVALQMRETGETFDEQATVVTNTQSIFASISTFMRQLEDSIEQVHQEVEHVVELKSNVVSSIEGVAATSQQAAAATEEIHASTDEQLRAITEVAQSAETLSRLSDQLQIAIQRFTL